jgi:hypothetical protein
MTTITAQTILRSRNTSAPEKVLSTLLLRYPRFIHAELMTHRVLSRNAASSRAIPVKKMIDDILADTAMPIHWGAAQKGMQADVECDAPIIIPSKFGLVKKGFQYTREEAWKAARDRVIDMARGFEEAGYHKQVVNRLLEPFLHITVLVSSTEWRNFLELRNHPDAEPHIQILAREIQKCLVDESMVQELQPGQWHLPFMAGCDGVYNGAEIDTDTAIKLSVAMCASTSYKTTDGFDMTLERAEAIYAKLVNSKPVHASPLEHVAQADSSVLNPFNESQRVWLNESQHRNFVGFRQLRAKVGA